MNPSNPITGNRVFLHKAVSVNMSLQDEGFDNIEESAEKIISGVSPRRKLKAFTTQIEARKSIIFQDAESNLDGEDFEEQLIKSTKRRYSFDEMSQSQSLMHFEEEERKMASKQNLDIKRNEIKKKKFMISEANPKGVKEDILEVQKIMSEETTNMIKSTLKSHFLFGNMDMIQIEGVVNKMFPCDIKKGQCVFQQGEPATSFFLIESGMLEVRMNDVLKRYLCKAEGFGELALLYNSPRSATIRAIEDSVIWGIDRATFQKVVQETIIKEYSINRRFIEGVDVFNCLTNQQKDELAGHVITQKFTGDQSIVHEGDPANCFFIIKEGIVLAYKGDKVVRELKEGESFGESALLYDSTRQMTIKAKNECIILALPKSTISEILGEHINVIAFRNLQKWGVEKSTNLKELTTVQRERIIDRMTIKFEKAGTILFLKNKPSKPKFVILHEGLIHTKKSNLLYQKGSLLGDDEELLRDSIKSYDDDYYFVVNSIISEISSEVLEEVLGNKLSNILKKNLNSHEKKINYSLIVKKQCLVDVELQDLTFIKRLGFGNYGSVYLVKQKKFSRFFALKAIFKQRIMENRIEKHLKQEKIVLESISFPFIVNFIKTLKDDLNIYFLMEFIKGMDLFDVIRQLGLLSTYDAQYYIGSIILAIEYLHINNIIHRDIKPENIMIDDKGFTKLIDMGTAKFLSRSNERNILKTFTIIGTPHYMAPEIVKSKGYSFPVDYWSIGICLYEFMCGMLPFGEDTEDPYEIYEEILKKEIKYPSYLKDKKARRLMNQLLSEVPEVRVNGSFGSIKADPWFGDFDWDKLIDGGLKAPYLPEENTKKLLEEISIMEERGIPIQEYILSEMQLSPGKIKMMVTKLEENWDDMF